MLGNFHDNVINIECETNSADLWVVDAEGVYIENIAMDSYLESDVIDAINAKYGTNFTHLTMQKVIGIAIGDDCPNWEAYEKIELDYTYWAAYIDGDKLLLGYFNNNNLYVQCVSNKDNAWVVNDNGVYIENIALSNFVEDNLKFTIEQLFEVSFSQIGYIQPSDISIGSICPRWNRYSKFVLPDL